MITTSNLTIKKNSKNNFTCSVDISISEKVSKTISIPFYEYEADDIKVFVKKRIQEEIQKIKDDILDEEEMKTKIGKI